MGFFTADAIEAIQKKDDKKKSRRKPARIPQLTKITSLATGTNHVLALDNKGKVYTWGAGEQGQLGRHIVQYIELGFRPLLLVDSAYHKSPTLPVAHIIALELTSRAKYTLGG
jgi:alpha-tubulin suppressor-like RCC1 family protein